MATLTFAGRRWLRSFNWPLAIAPVLLSLLGILTIASADLHNPGAAAEWKKQVFYMFVGIGVMIGLSYIDYRKWRRWAPAIYGINFALLAFILIHGVQAKGAVRWISLGPFGQFQPSEPAKLFLAIAIAAALCRGSYKRLPDLLLPLVLTAIPAVMILKQPDLGTTLVVLAILTTQLFFALPNLGDFGIYCAGVAVAAAAAFALKIIKPFQMARLLVFVNPKLDPQGAGYNLHQSKIAVGNGQWFGRGLHHGTQTQLDFVPEHSRDFIFTVVGEELGFLGALVLIGLYTVVLYGGIRTLFVARDRFGFLLSAGLIAMFVFHIMVNIGMTVGIMPITGIPLPFMSYGGSAMLTNYAAVGILLNIYAQKDRIMLGNE